jgi:hypothetical protein
MSLRGVSPWKLEIQSSEYQNQIGSAMEKLQQQKQASELDRRVRRQPALLR